MSKTWATVAKTDLSQLDFTKLGFEAPESCITNLAEDTALIKWTGDKPTELDSVAHTTLSHSEAVVLVTTPEWYREID